MKIRSVKKIRYHVLKFSALIVGSLILSFVVISLLNYFDPPNKSTINWWSSLIFGGIWGWFNPLSRHYDKKLSENDKKFCHQHALFDCFLSELITYNRIKPDDMLMVYYIPFDRTQRKILEQRPFKILEQTNLEPKLVISSSRMGLVQLAMFFKDNSDYMLAKLALKDNGDCLEFYRGKDILKMAK